jgi:putative colanic acid biosynthesis acetyltransferase WcaF
VGSNVWIGEGVWIDNLVDVKIRNNVCLSQGSYILTGSHDYKKSTFDLILGPIVLEDGVWIGAKSTVCPGVTCSEHSVLALGSVATTNLIKYGIYQGNPAVFKRKRLIEC